MSQIRWVVFFIVGIFAYGFGMQMIGAGDEIGSTIAGAGVILFCFSAYLICQNIRGYPSSQSWLRMGEYHIVRCVDHGKLDLWKVLVRSPDTGQYRFVLLSEPLCPDTTKFTLIRDGDQKVQMVQFPDQQNL